MTAPWTPSQLAAINEREEARQSEIGHASRRYRASRIHADECDKAPRPKLGIVLFIAIAIIIAATVLGSMGVTLEDFR